MTKKITLSPSIDFSDSGNLPSLFFLSFFLFFPYFIYRCVIYLFPSCFLCIYLCIYIYIYIYRNLCMYLLLFDWILCARCFVTFAVAGPEEIGPPPTPSIGRRRKLTPPARPAIAKKKNLNSTILFCFFLFFTHKKKCVKEFKWIRLKI